MRKDFPIAGTVTALVLISLAGTPRALGDTWDNSAGNALWSTATNWADNTVPTINDFALFPNTIPGGQSIITCPTNTVALSLNFLNSYTLIGGFIQLGNGTISGGGWNPIIRSSLAGTGPLTFSGGGTISVLPTSSNSYTGGTIISGTSTTVVVTTNSALGFSTAPITLNGGRLRLDGSVNPTFIMLRDFTLGTGGGTIDLINNAFLDLNRPFAATANTLTVTGTGSAEFNSSSTRTGNTTINGPLVRLNGAQTLGTGTTNVFGTGILELANSITYTRPIGLGEGATLQGGSGQSTCNGSCNVFGTNVTLNGGPTSSDTLILGSSGANVLANGATSTIKIMGFGTVDLAAANSYSGNWQIGSATQAGKLRVSHADALGTSTAPVDVSAMGTLQLNLPTFARDIALNRRLDGIELLQNVTFSGSISVPDFGASLVARPFVGNFDVTLTSAGSSLNMVNAVQVGTGAGKTIRLLNGADVASGTVFDYGSASAPGNIVVNGAGSSWDCNDYMQIAQGGPGSLSVEAGGAVSAETFFVGIQLHTGEVGATTVTGAGSTLTCTNTLWAGYDPFNTGGVATFSVLDGADVTSGAGIVGSGATNTTATVSGVGSTWNVQNLLEVGQVPSSDASLNITNGGEFSCAGLFLGNGANTTATLNISGQSHLTCGLSGIILSQNGAASTLNFSGGIIDINGNITDAGPGQSAFTLDGATLDMHNHAIGGATPIDIPAFRSGTLKNVSQINNGLGFNKNGTGTLFLNTTNSYTGATTVSDGTLYLVDAGGSNTGPGQVIVGNSGTLAGNGRTAGPVLNDGAVSPQGFNFDNTATLHMQSTYTQLAGGTLHIQIDTGGAHDALEVASQAVLFGTLDVSLLNAYVPAPGSTFEIITAASFNGEFTTTNLPALPPGSQWAVEYLPTAVRLSVTGGCDSIDFNNDTLYPDTTDLDDFLSVFSGGPCSTGTCNDVDFNNDGLFPDTSDFDALLSVFSGGPCF